MTTIDRAIAKLDEKIAVLQLAKAELLTVRDAEFDEAASTPAPKKRGRPRTRKAGLPTIPSDVVQDKVPF